MHRHTIFHVYSKSLKFKDKRFIVTNYTTISMDAATEILNLFGINISHTLFRFLYVCILSLLQCFYRDVFTVHVVHNETWIIYFVLQYLMTVQTMTQ